MCYHSSVSAVNWQEVEMQDSRKMREWDFLTDHEKILKHLWPLVTEIRCFQSCHLCFKYSLLHSGGRRFSKNCRIVGILNSTLYFRLKRVKSVARTAPHMYWGAAVASQACKLNLCRCILSPGSRSFLRKNRNRAKKGLPHSLGGEPVNS